MLFLGCTWCCGGFFEVYSKEKLIVWDTGKQQDDSRLCVKNGDTHRCWDPQEESRRWVLILFYINEIFYTNNIIRYMSFSNLFFDSAVCLRDLSMLELKKKQNLCLNSNAQIWKLCHGWFAAWKSEPEWALINENS